MIRVLEGRSRRMDQLRPTDFYNPNWREFIGRPAKLSYDLLAFLPSIGADFVRALPRLPDAVGAPLRRFASAPSYVHFEKAALALLQHVSPTREIPALTNHIPSGFFDNASLEHWLRRNLERMRMPNDFRAFKRKRNRSLYITACDLDTAERELFGPDERCDATISQAVQASTALPLFYKPARINGVDYVDGGVRHTASIDVAIDKGADLIICYNPFRPFLNRIDADGGTGPYFANGRYLSDRGLKVVLNQVFRTLLHSRLKLGLQRYLTDDRFQGDILLLEPRERDAEFFNVNPLAFWKRSDAIQHGFESVRMTLEQNFDAVSDVLSHYGLEMSRDAARKKAHRVRAERGWLQPGGETLDAESEADARAPLRLVRTESA
jgi:predicted acylesterase/phospholipase RssA